MECIGFAGLSTVALRLPLAEMMCDICGQADPAGQLKKWWIVGTHNNYGHLLFVIIMMQNLAGKGRQWLFFLTAKTFTPCIVTSPPPLPQNHKLHRIKDFQEFLLMIEFPPLFVLFFIFSLLFFCIHSFFCNKVGDPVLLVFDSGARGFLSLPKPLFGSECDDNNPAGTFPYTYRI